MREEFEKWWHGDDTSRHPQNTYMADKGAIRWAYEGWLRGAAAMLHSLGYNGSRFNYAEGAAEGYKDGLAEGYEAGPLAESEKPGGYSEGWVAGFDTGYDAAYGELKDAEERVAAEREACAKAVERARLQIDGAFGVTHQTDFIATHITDFYVAVIRARGYQ